MSRLRETYKQLRQKKEGSPPVDYVTRPAKQHKTYFENRSFVYVDHSQRRLSTQRTYENSIKSLNLLNPPAFNYLWTKQKDAKHHLYKVIISIVYGNCLEWERYRKCSVGTWWSFNSIKPDHTSEGGPAFLCTCASIPEYRRPASNWDF